MGSRRSQFIGPRQATAFFAAEQHAARIGRSPTVFVTLNFGMVALEGETVSKAFERLRDHHFTRWFRYQSQRRHAPEYGPPTYLWVVEHSGGCEHVHWNVFVPPELMAAFKGKLEPWVTKTGGAVLDNDAIHTRTPDRKAALYMMKGIEHRYASHFRIRYPQYQGAVDGKRCGFSENLGPRAIHLWHEAHARDDTAEAGTAA